MMRKILAYSILLVAGLAGSQFLPDLFGPIYKKVDLVLTFCTLAALSFIMIHVGLEFELDKSNPRKYGKDYLIAATAAAFPWVFCSLYFVFLMAPSADWWTWEVWKESLLVGRFASPTSAGVLFAMLAAAGLSSTWVYRKARVLAIFDDLDTILLMIPLKVAIIGLKWQLGIVVVFILVLLWLAWRYLHRIRLPSTWGWVLAYSAAIAFASEVVYYSTKAVYEIPIHIEVLLPAFVLGCVMRRPSEAEEGGHGGAGGEERAATVISMVFMVLVGLSMPAITVCIKDCIAGGLSWGMVVFHVIVITVISNIGKMFPAFCYRNEATLRERLAVSVGMFPRGEVGAGVLVLSMTFVASGDIITVAALSLALNLVLTGVFIYFVKRLIAGQRGFDG